MSFLSSLFGGGDYGAGGFLNDYKNTIGQEQGLVGQYGSLASQAGQDYGRYSSGYSDALTNYANLLKQNPYTDSYSTSVLNQATNGLTNDYLGAKAALTADLARRGLASPGADSSMLTGGLASIEAQRAGQLAAAQNNLAMQEIDRQYQNDQALTDLYGGAANTAYGRETGALGEQAGLLQNIGQGQMGLYENARQQQAQHNSAMLGFIGGLIDPFAQHFAGLKK